MSSPKTKTIISKLYKTIWWLSLTALVVIAFLSLKLVFNLNSEKVEYFKKRKIVLQEAQATIKKVEDDPKLLDTVVKERQRWKIWDQIPEKQRPKFDPNAYLLEINYSEAVQLRDCLLPKDSNLACTEVKGHAGRDILFEKGIMWNPRYVGSPWNELPIPYLVLGLGQFVFLNVFKKWLVWLLRNEPQNLKE